MCCGAIAYALQCLGRVGELPSHIQQLRNNPKSDVCCSGMASVLRWHGRHAYTHHGVHACQEFDSAALVFDPLTLVF